MSHTRKATHACRDCGAPIRWATTPKGKRIPLDESSDPQGNWLYTGPKEVTYLHGWELERHRIAIATRETSRLLFNHHSATCTENRPRPHVPDHVIQRAYDAVKKGQNA